MSSSAPDEIFANEALLNAALAGLRDWAAGRAVEFPLDPELPRQAVLAFASRSALKPCSRQMVSRRFLCRFIPNYSPRLLRASLPGFECSVGFAHDVRAKSPQLFFDAFVSAIHYLGVLHNAGAMGRAECRDDHGHAGADIGTAYGLTAKR